MKKLILIASALVFAFTSCDKVEDAINDSIPDVDVEQTVTEEFTIDALDLGVAGPITETINIDTAEINAEIDKAASSDNIEIEDIKLDDLEIKLAEGSEQTNFNFLDTLKLTISSDNDSTPVVIDFGEIAENIDTLSIPEGVDSSILDLIQGTDVGELTIDIDMVTNAAVENDIDLELVSTLLATLGFSI